VAVKTWIANPTDARENFADRWNDQSSLKAAFYEWLEDARTDFRRAAQVSQASDFVAALAPRMGRRLVEKAAESADTKLTGISPTIQKATTALQRILNAPHRQPPQWPTVRAGTVSIARATFEQPGFRPTQFRSDGPPLPNGAKLRFEANTDVQRPYRVFWQIVNTGAAARAANDLRGGFVESYVEVGHLTRKENSKYTGSHSIECFIVKNGYCVARSDIFLVNID